MSATCGIHVRDELGNPGQQLQRLAFRSQAQGDGKLLGDDDDADRGQQSVDGSAREELAEDSRAEEAEQDLQHAGGHADAQGQPVGLQVGRRVAATREPELGDAADRDHDQAGRGPLDGELRIAQRAAHEAADDRREDAGDRRIPAGQRDAEAQRQRDEEDEEARERIGFPIGAQLAKGAPRYLVRLLSHVSPPPLPHATAARPQTDA